MIKVVSTWCIREGLEDADIGRRYLESQVSDARNLPRLRRCVLLRGIAGEDGGAPCWWRGEDLWFDNFADLSAASRSDGWHDVGKGDFLAALTGFERHLFVVEEEYRAPDAPEPGLPSTHSVIVPRAMWRIPDGRRSGDVDEHYFDIHVPNVRRLPRLHRHVILRAIDWPDGRPATYWRGAETWFGSREDSAIRSASDEARVAANDGFTDLIADLEFASFRVDHEWQAS